MMINRLNVELIRRHGNDKSVLQGSITATC